MSKVEQLCQLLKRKWTVCLVATEPEMVLLLTHPPCPGSLSSFSAVKRIYWKRPKNFCCRPLVSIPPTPYGLQHTEKKNSEVGKIANCGRERALEPSKTRTKKRGSLSKIYSLLRDHLADCADHRVLCKSWDLQNNLITIFLYHYPGFRRKLCPKFLDNPFPSISIPILCI
jgi:hypothetical protein